MAVISHDMDNFNLAVNTHVDPRRVEAVPVGAERQLLVDDFFLAMGRGHEQYPRNIAWTLGTRGQARRAPVRGESSRGRRAPPG